jgi:membrane-associated phospholipid phosphatase
MAQTAVNRSYTEYLKDTAVLDAKHAFNLGISIVQAPLHFDGSDLKYLIFTGAITSSLLTVDPHVKEYAQSNRSDFKDKLFKFDDYFNGQHSSYAAAGIYLGGFFLKEEKLRLTGLYLMETLFISQIITSSLKYVFGRRRPWSGDDHMDFKLFRGDKGKFRSFPSGHTTSAVAFGSVMAMAINNTTWKVFWYSSASLVALSRIYNNNHWLTDTVLAAAITHSIARYVVNFSHEKDADNSSVQNLSIYAIPGQVGIRVLL